MKELKGAYKFINEEFLANLQKIDTRDDSEKLETLRQSVRRLVGEWEQRAANCDSEIKAYKDGNKKFVHEAIYEQAAITSRQCAKQLSALIDGKNSKQEKL